MPGFSVTSASSLLEKLRSRARKGLRGYPVATVAFYGPDDQRASKVVVGLMAHAEAEPELRKWFSETGDVRWEVGTLREIHALLQEHGAKSVAMSAGIMGCPHEEGIDYRGKVCPRCPFWAGRDRWSSGLVREPEPEGTALKLALEAVEPGSPSDQKALEVLELAKRARRK